MSASYFEVVEFDCSPNGEYFDEARELVDREIIGSKGEAMSAFTFSRLTRGNRSLGAFDEHDELAGVCFIDLNPTREDIPYGVAWLNLLAVDRRLQRMHGIGSALLTRAETLAALEQMHTMALKPTDTSLDFYGKHHGYESTMHDTMVKTLLS